MRRTLLATLALASAAPALAQQQNMGAGEVVVTAQRREITDYDALVPVIGLRRLADYAVQPVRIVGDTREADRRRDEIFQMVKAAIDLAGKRDGIEIAIGDTVVEPLTLANYRNLRLRGDGRPDSERVEFLVKTRLQAGMDARTALDRITAFIKAVPPVGRAQLETAADLTLSVVRPDQYRDQIVELVAADARTLAGRFGPGYAAEVRNIDRPVEWTRDSLTEVFLYIPYALTIVPEK